MVVKIFVANDERNEEAKKSTAGCWKLVERHLVTMITKPNTRAHINKQKCEKREQRKSAEFWFIRLSLIHKNIPHDKNIQISV